MDSLVTNDHKKPHVIFVAFPAQSHVKATLKLASFMNKFNTCMSGFELETTRLHTLRMRADA